VAGLRATIPFAVIGLGKLGAACGQAILQAEDLRLAGYVLRPERVDDSSPSAFAGVPTATGIEALGAIDAALVCLPRYRTTDAVHDLLQCGVPLVECAIRWDQAAADLQLKLHRLAVRHHVRASVGAGWVPGAVELFQALFAMLIPKGYTEATERPGRGLHHTLTAKAVDGLRNALCTELRSVEGNRQRYVYVEFAPDADPDRVSVAIRAEPLFLDEETLVFPVESVAALEEQGAGIVLQRRGSAGGAEHRLPEALGHLAVGAVGHAEKQDAFHA
jgi:diaminopimelate dehydrogenase